jgi:hypothetical protein
MDEHHDDDKTLHTKVKMELVMREIEMDESGRR